MELTSPRRILIADDEANIVVSLEFLMRRAGYAVRSVADGEAALRELAGFLPHLILLDVMLPVHDGFEVCRRIRNDPRLQAIRIVMLTARGRPVEVERGLALGADLYIAKPFSTRELSSCVHRLLQM
jgi:two-component system, OmpR family, alkaline phosphatase synthesis response regulator PhoP